MYRFYNDVCFLFIFVSKDTFLCKNHAPNLNFGKFCGTKLNLVDTFWSVKIENLKYFLK